MVLDDSGLDVAQEVVCHSHHGERSHVPVVNLEHALVSRFCLV